MRLTKASWGSKMKDEEKRKGGREGGGEWWWEKWNGDESLEIMWKRKVFRKAMVNTSFISWPAFPCCVTSALHIRTCVISQRRQQIKRVCIADWQFEKRVDPLRRLDGKLPARPPDKAHTEVLDRTIPEVRAQLPQCLACTLRRYSYIWRKTVALAKSNLAQSELSSRGGWTN